MAESARPHLRRGASRLEVWARRALPIFFFVGAVFMVGGESLSLVSLSKLRGGGSAVVGEQQHVAAQAHHGAVLPPAAQLRTPSAAKAPLPLLPPATTNVASAIVRAATLRTSGPARAVPTADVARATPLSPPPLSSEQPPLEKGSGSIPFYSAYPASQVLSGALEYVLRKDPATGKYANMRFIDRNTARTPAATTNSAAAATGFEPLAKASRTLVFTMCFHGVGVGAGDVAQLCDAWWSFFELWGPANNVAVAMVTGDGGKIDPTRAPHWAKVYYSHAFLQDAAPGGKYDLVVFTDSDSAFRYRTWDIVQYSNTKLKGQKLWLMPEDDFDYLSTGTMFMKNHDVTRKWLRAWYAETPQMYGRLALGNELAGHEGVWDPDNFKDPRPFLSTQRWENWWNGSPTVKESKGPANWLLAGAKEWRNNRVAATLKERPRHNIFEWRAVAQRCSPWYLSHEQGCQMWVYTLHPEFVKHLLVETAGVIHHFREGYGAYKQWVVYHYCCTDYKERKMAIQKCTTLFKAGKNCGE